MSWRMCGWERPWCGGILNWGVHVWLSSQKPGQFSRSQTLPARVMVVPHMVTLRTYKVVPILSNLEWLVQWMCGSPGPPQIAVSSMKTLTLFFVPQASDGISNAVRRHCDLRPFIRVLPPARGNEPRSYERCSQPGPYGGHFPHPRGSVTLSHWVITGRSWISCQSILPTINPGSISIKMSRLWFLRGL